MPTPPVFAGIEWYDAALRMVLALLMGMIVGLERERMGRPAGLRTQALVALGAAMYTAISIGMGRGSDPSRIAAQIVVGIGFLGAGTIMRHGNMLQGLTTAASVWVSAAIGMACGLAWYPVAAVGTGLAFVTMSLIRPLAKKVRRAEKLILLQVWVHGERAKLGDVMARIEATGAHLHSVELHPTDMRGVRRAAMYLELPPSLDMEKMVQTAQEIGGVTDVEAEEVEW
jgi:putative Mg2+ transporter-C (MgtC) family protein